MRVHSHATDESSLRNKAHNPNNSATTGYSLTAFAVPLLPRPHLLLSQKRPLPWRNPATVSYSHLRARHEISVSNISCIWTNCIVPFSVERVGTNIYFFNLFV